MVLTDGQLEELAERLQWASDLTDEQRATVKDNIEDYLENMDKE